jgi:hypothetical protein
MQMRGLITILLCGLALRAAAPSYADASNVLADPAIATPGQTIMLRWYFTGSKVTVSGGRFGKGTVVTGRTFISDTPQKTTTYAFDVWYRAPAPSSATGKQEMQQVHTRYTTQVEVVSQPDFAPYRDPHGWEVRFLKGWKRDQVRTPDEGSDGLNFFQLEDDSVERMAVSILPVKEMSCKELMDSVQKDVPSHYNEVEVVSQTETIHENVPALQVIFTGMDQSHPGTRTESIVLIFVRNGRGYVVSARTKATNFAARRKIMEAMVRSFHFSGGAPAAKSTANR